LEDYNKLSNATDSAWFRASSYLGRVDPNNEDQTHDFHNRAADRIKVLLERLDTLEENIENLTDAINKEISGTPSESDSPSNENS
jgi:hypothetical protein